MAKSDKKNRLKSSATILLVLQSAKLSRSTLAFSCGETERETEEREGRGEEETAEVR